VVVRREAWIICSFSWLLELACAIERVFKAAGWSTERVHTGADALQFLTKFKFDLIILDWNLPDMSGPAICQQFRTAGGETPIMFLTGRNTTPDKEVGLDSGGDEYITKPFDNRELLARARAMLRRPALSAEARSLMECGLILEVRV
jgi:two-component system, OmpR family, manganese sensing response regulator